MKNLKFKSLALAIVMVLCVVAGSFSVKGEASTHITITFSWWGDKARNDATVKAINLWNKNHSDIQVEGIPMGWDAYHDKLFTEFAANAAPDIFQLSANRFQEFAVVGALMDITPYINTNFKGIDYNLWAGVTIGDKVYGVDSGIIGSGLAYNATKLKKLKISYPSDSETWDTLYTRCKNATRDTNKNGKIDLWGISDPLDTDPVTYNDYVRPFELSVWTKDYKGCNFYNSKVISTLKKFEKFRNAKVVVPPNVAVLDGQTYMAIGASAYEVISLSSYPALVSSTKDKISLVLPPKPFKGGKDLRVCTGTNPISIWDKSKHPEAAIQFLSWFLTNADAAKAMPGMPRGVFPSKTQRDAVYGNLSSALKSVVSIANKTQALKHTANNMVPNGYSEFLDIFTMAKNRYLLGQTTFNGFMNEVQKNGNKVLAQY